MMGMMLHEVTTAFCIYDLAFGCWNGIFEVLAIYFVLGVFLNLMGTSSASSRHAPGQQFLSLIALGAAVVVQPLTFMKVCKLPCTPLASDHILRAFRIVKRESTNGGDPERVEVG